jgi:hypothetical protein
LDALQRGGRIMTLELLEDEYSVYKFKPDYNIDENILSGEFYSVTRTKDELSVVAQQDKFSVFLESEDGWKILKINGPLDFSLIGILSKISSNPNGCLSQPNGCLSQPFGYRCKLISAKVFFPA